MGIPSFKVHLGRRGPRQSVTSKATYYGGTLHRGFTRYISHTSNIVTMQLTSVLSAALLPLLAFAQDTTLGTTTMTQTSTLTKTITLATNIETDTATLSSTANSTTFASATATASRVVQVYNNATAAATGASSSSTASASASASDVSSGAASLSSAHVAIVGMAGMLVVSLM